jgi:hypothetical protein
MSKCKVGMIVLISSLVLAQVLGCKSKENIIETDTAMPNTNTQVVSMKSWYQEIVDSVKSLQPGSMPTGRVNDFNTNRTREDFNVNQYFSVLPNLTMEDGYVLDYVYLYSGNGGKPFVYARQKAQESFDSYEKYSENVKDSISTINPSIAFSSVMRGTPVVFVSKIKVDGTPEGFFEYIVLQMLGGQFYLWWHAGYYDVNIICDSSKLDDLAGPTISSSEIPMDILQKARQLDFQPVIEIIEQTVNVKIIVFTKWGGFIRLTITINREYPHSIISIQQEQLVEYYCGIVL